MRPDRQDLQLTALAPRTTLGVGGPARDIVSVDADRDDDNAAILRAIDEPFYLLGGGSNVLIADAGLDAPVVLLASRGVVWRDTDTSDADQAIVEVDAAAGEPWDALVQQSVTRGLSGIECLSGIPGCVGATPIQNVGAYGQQVSDCVVSVRVLDLDDGVVRDVAAADCAFAYRDSVFKSGALARRVVVLRVRYRLRRGAPAAPRYGQLSRALEQREGADLDGTAVRREVLALRRAKGMVVDPRDSDSHSAGSFFLNPVVSPARADDVEQRAGAATSAMPRYDAPGGVKLAAAWLIERAGFSRGYGEGAAGLSRKHALAIVNRGGARASDIVALAREIADGVQRRLGVQLQPEPQMLGFSQDELGSLAAPAAPLGG